MRGRTRMRGVVVGVVVCGLLAGCTSKEPGPEPSVVVAVSPTAGADLACGVDRAAIEAVSGYPVDRVTGELSVQEGVGSGRCEVWTDERDGVLFVVELWPLSSEKALRVRDLVDGKVGNPATYTYDPSVADGAMWNANDVPFENVSGSVLTYIFWGDTLVKIYFSAVAPLRTPSQDFLAITEQVATTYGLQRPGAAG